MRYKLPNDFNFMQLIYMNGISEVDWASPCLDVCRLLTSTGTGKKAYYSGGGVAYASMLLASASQKRFQPPLPRPLVLIEQKL